MMSSNSSKYACPKCGNPNIQTERSPDGFHRCMDCLYSWKHEKEVKPTVFKTITASPEVLAENLLHCIWYPHGRRWISTIIVWKEFEDKIEAYEATVEKLKEVAE